MNDNINEVINKLKTFSQKEKAKFLPKFFNTDTKNNDKFIGVSVPNIRNIAKEYSYLSIENVFKLMENEIHEVRLAALFILDLKFKKSNENKRKRIVELYLTHTKYVNNWDLVDSSASKIIGEYLVDKQRDLLYELAKSDYIWERRIAIVSTFAFIRINQLVDSINLSRLLLKDKNAYIHKAVGWTLREVGKKDIKILENFIQKNYKDMPRISLRYCIERFSEKQRKLYLKGIF